MTIGETLAAARTQRGLSVEDVTAATRIRPVLVRAIEADDFAPCGGAVYARGHIRAIAKVVGVDSAPLMTEFDRLHGTQPGLLTGPVPDPEALAASQRRGPNWAAAAAVALVIVIVLAGSQLLRNGGSSDGRASAPRATATASSSPRHSASPAPTRLAQLPTTGVTVVVRITGLRSWLAVTNSAGATVFTGVLAQGQSKSWHDEKQLRLVIGNSPGVDLVVNGHDVGSPGRSSVSHVVFGPGDPAAGG